MYKTLCNNKAITITNKAITITIRHAEILARNVVAVMLCYHVRPLVNTGFCSDGVSLVNEIYYLGKKY